MTAWLSLLIAFAALSAGACSPPASETAPPAPQTPGSSITTPPTPRQVEQAAPPTSTGCQPWDYFCVEDRPLPAALAGARLGPNGLGPLRMGMSIDDVQRLVGGELQHDNVSDSDACREYPIAWRDGNGVVVMTQDRRVTRVSVFGGGFEVKTAEGIGIGSAGQAVMEAYPGAIRSPAAYDGPPAYELLYWATPDRAGVRFEMGAFDTVAAIHAGDASIRYIEGCL